MGETLRDILAAKAAEKAKILNFRTEKLKASIREREIILDGFRLRAKERANEIRANDEIVTDADEETIAVNLMMAEGYVPPHFTGSTDCAKCGFMPNEPGFKKTRVHACPWCHTDHGLRGKLMQRVEPYSEIEQWQKRQAEKASLAADIDNWG